MSGTCYFAGSSADMYRANKMQKCEKDIQEIEDARPYSSTERLPKELTVFGMVMGSD